MNKKIFDEIIITARTFSMTKEEKKAVMDKVSIFMKENPLSLSSSTSSGVVSPYGFIPSFLIRYKFVPIAVLLLIVFGGGTSFAAKSSLPGDILYSIKININEKIESVIAFGDEAEAKVAISQASERLSEAEKLSVKGKISKQAKIDIIKNLNIHTDEVKVLTAKIKEEGREEAATTLDSDLKSTLEAHAAIIADLKTDESDASDIETDRKEDKVDEIKSSDKDKEEADTPDKDADDNKEVNIDPEKHPSTQTEEVGEKDTSGVNVKEDTSVKIGSSSSTSLGL